MNSWAQNWFRALTSGLILADMIGHFGSGDTATEANSEDWPQIWLAIARAAGNGDVAEIVRQQASLQRLEATHPAVATLGLMPLILTTPEIMALARQPLGLQAATWHLVDYLYSRLWSIATLQVPAGVPLFFLPPLILEPLNWPAPEQADPAVAAWVQPLEALNRTCLGQFAVAMGCLRRQGVSGGFPWMGLLIGAQGLEQLPLTWRERFLQGSQLRSRWQLENEQSAWQLADRLYHRWVGRISTELSGEHA